MIAERVAELMGVPVRAADRVGGGCICPAYRVLLGDGRTVFAKTHPDPPAGFFAAEARGLRWLGAADAGLVPAVLGCADDAVVLDWVEQASPSAGAADAFGRSLAALHLAGADAFGADRPGYIGSLPLDNAPSGDWPTFYAERRLAPYLRLAVDRGAIGPSDRAAVERVINAVATVAGDPEPPARIHGDLWSGNVLWVDGGVRLVDPAAHGGHRETDLAMLALFGAPYLDRVLAAYAEAHPLGEGWRERVALHQLHPLLVHAALFGGGYGARAGSAARASL